MKNIIIPTILMFIVSYAMAQKIEITADIRMRYEYRHGFSTLFHDTAHAAHFVTQRSRMLIDFSNKNMRIRISPQNTRVWGDVATMSKSDPNNQLHEAWAEWLAAKNFTIKAGRQELNYDDARILGNVDWAMQARSHDLLLLKYLPDSNHSLHTGFALNANKESLVKENYAIPGQYRNMQMLWYQGKRNAFRFSFLLLNQGIPYLHSNQEKISYNQTFGPRVTFGKSKFSADAAYYKQTGKLGVNKISADYLSVNFQYKTTSGFTPGVGFEFLSGHASNQTMGTSKSFYPWFGTNHKFNGYMDYFYVGNHFNSVGLTDIYIHLAYEIKKLAMKITPHYFATAAPLYKIDTRQQNYLGTEIDFTFQYQPADMIQIQCGYSQMFATVSMQVLKGGKKNLSNHWAFVSIYFNPKIWRAKKEY